MGRGGENGGEGERGVRGRGEWQVIERHWRGTAREDTLTRTAVRQPAPIPRNTHTHTHYHITRYKPYKTVHPPRRPYKNAPAR